MPKISDPNRPGMREAMRNKCFECCGDMLDGRMDCGIVTCSLYYWQPYRKQEPDTSWRENGSHLKKNRKALLERYRGRGGEDVMPDDDMDDMTEEDDE